MMIESCFNQFPGNLLSFADWPLVFFSYWTISGLGGKHKWKIELNRLVTHEVRHEHNLPSLSFSLSLALWPCYEWV